MEQNTKTIAIIAGAGISAVAAYFIYKAMKPKTDITLQYYSDDEANAVDIIKNKINPKDVIKGWIDVRTITKPLIVVGGQYANPVYGDLVNLGVMPPITAGDTNGYIYVRVYSGQTIYGVAGDLAQHTMAAAQYIAEYGLPATDVTISITAGLLTCNPCRSRRVK